MSSRARRSHRRLWLGLSVGLGVAVAAGAAIGHSALKPAVREVELQRSDGRVQRMQFRCSADLRSAQQCAKLDQLSRKGVERCLQIWGGAGRAVITDVGSRRRTVITRSNSCEIHRWRQLVELSP